jgi:putative ABC transport system permease protein
MRTIVQDFHFALRQLRKNPGFACTAIVILGLGIGATTAIFSAVNPILFEPLPYPQASRLMMIWYAAGDGSRIPQTFHTFREVAERNRAFESVAVADAWQPTFTGAEQPERVDGQSVSADFFRTLGVAPAIGRDFQAADDLPNDPKVLIMSNAAWRGRFGGDSAIIGRSVKLDGDNFTVIGVMPAGFENVLAASAEFWTPLQYDAGNIVSQQTREWGHHLRMMVRLRPGVSRDLARSDLDRIAHSRIPDFPRPTWASLDQGFIATSLQDDLAGGVKPALLAIVGAVSLVLLIACVNVANLLLARGVKRRGEFAVRATLGATRTRVIRQLLTESLLLALLGALVGMAVAQLGMRALVALSPSELPRVLRSGSTARYSRSHSESRRLSEWSLASFHCATLLAATCARRRRRRPLARRAAIKSRAVFLWSPKLPLPWFCLSALDFCCAVLDACSPSILALTRRGS